MSYKRGRGNQLEVMMPAATSTAMEALNVMQHTPVEVQMSRFNPIHRKCAFPSGYNWASPWYILRGYDLS